MIDHDTAVTIEHPAWCDHTAHGSDDDGYTRWLGRVGPLWAHDEFRDGQSNLDVQVQAECLDGLNQTPEILVCVTQVGETYAHLTPHLDAVQARRLAAMLLEGADMLDSVTVAARVAVAA